MYVIDERMTFPNSINVSLHKTKVIFQIKLSIVHKTRDQNYMCSQST